MDVIWGQGTRELMVGGLTTTHVDAMTHAQSRSRNQAGSQGEDARRLENRIDAPGAFKESIIGTIQPLPHTFHSDCVYSTSNSLLVTRKLIYLCILVGPSV